MKSAIPRALLLCMGLVPLFWVFSFIPLFRLEAPVNATAATLLAGDTVPEATIAALVPRIAALQSTPQCLPKGLRSSIVLETRLTQDAIDANNVPQRDALLLYAEELVKKSLRCSPISSYSWFALFWIDSLRQGFSDRSIGYLEMSYLTGPREGWISIRRNYYGFALFDRLPATLQAKIVSEFSDLVNAGFVADAADILTGAAWNYRDVVVAGLSAARQPTRRNLAMLLRRKGVNIAIPGVDLPDLRPWN